MGQLVILNFCFATERSALSGRCVILSFNSAKVRFIQQSPGEDETLKANSEGLTKELQNLPPEEISVLAKSFSLRLKDISELDNKQQGQALSTVNNNAVFNSDTEELLAVYRLLPETERRNLYRVVCLRHKELARLYEKYINNKQLI